MMGTIKQGTILLLWMTALTGILYPFTMTYVAQTFFNKKANGSLIEKEEVLVGSLLIAQKFTQDKYFWPRPSASDYNTLPSSGSNFGPTREEFKKVVNERRQYLMEKNHIADPSNVPPNLLFASGSGLDPDIMIASALFQLNRVAKARNMDNEAGVKKLKDLIYSVKTAKTLNLFGRDCVNVLKLNLKLDELEKKRGEALE